MKIRESSASLRSSRLLDRSLLFVVVFGKEDSMDGKETFIGSRRSSDSNREHTTQLAPSQFGSQLQTQKEPNAFGSGQKNGCFIATRLNQNTRRKVATVSGNEIATRTA